MMDQKQEAAGCSSRDRLVGEIRKSVEEQSARAGYLNECGGQCATSAPRPNIWSDPRGWAHDICANHAPSPDGLQRIAAIRAGTENLINEILRSCPDSSDRHQAIGAARMAMMFANASIALDGRV